MPLSPPTLAEFQRENAELRERQTIPPKLHALHSSAALAINVFEHWRKGDASPLLQPLYIDSALKSLAFEQPFPTHLPGTPPNVDVALELASGAVVAIESKFTEWLTPKRTNRPAFRPKYFEGGVKRWATAGLPGCQKLAAALMQGTERFKLLDAAQLLKHALGLATQRPGRFSLYYLFYDTGCPLSAVHREEIVRFTARAGAELGFRAIAYQALYHHWCGRPDVDPGYLQYLGNRYFD